MPERRDDPFVVSAPGKVIVFGEHAVVHGKAAIAAAVSLRSYLLVSRSNEQSPRIRLLFPDVKLDHIWRTDDLPWSAFAHASKAKLHGDSVTVLDDDLLKALRPHIQAVSPKVPDQLRQTHHAAASAFLYLLLSLESENIGSVTYTLRSTLPIGAGLGSSASISVCISAALLAQSGVLEVPRDGESTKEIEAKLEMINNWAFVGELNIHGKPSGIDNTVATRGKAVLYKKSSQPGGKASVIPLHEFPILPLLLVDTKQNRSTAVEVAKVGKLRDVYPSIANPILDAIDKITESAHTMLSGSHPGDSATVQAIGELASINHGLLVALGVSHPKLERIRELIDHDGIGWTKLTGAGGGGCSITILRPDVPQQVLHELESRLDREGFEKFETLLGGNGVGILCGADLSNDANGINEDSMLLATGNEELENLVGMEKRSAWSFWGR